MPFFFFGTLMDRDVLERVLDRPVPDDQLVPALLPGYRRVKAAAADYPALVPCPGGAVEGVVLRATTPRDEARILHFEADEYEPRVLPVRLLDDDRPAAARVFLALPALGRTDEHWDPETWARRHKEGYLRLCDEWMSDCPK